MKQTIRLLGVFLSCIMMSACAQKMTKEVGQLNLQYNFPAEKTAQTDKTIALLSPEVMKPQVSPQMQPANSFVAAILAAQNGGGRKVDFNERYASEYEGPVRTAFDNSLQELLTRKGFHLKGPFGSFDDMAYNDRKSTYLALAPVLKIFIDKKVTDSSVSNWSKVKTETGSISVTGELQLNFIEPVTKERILAKRINLSDFNIQREYRVQAKLGSSGLMVDAITSNQELDDNSDKVLTEAVNEFYGKAMDRITTMISTEELLSYQKSVDELKGLKRY